MVILQGLTLPWELLIAIGCLLPIFIEGRFLDWVTLLVKTAFPFVLHLVLRLLGLILVLDFHLDLPRDGNLLLEGARFKGTNRLGKASWSTKPTITTADRGTAFEFKVPGKSGPTWRYEFEPVAGGTRVVESVRQQAPSPAVIRFIQRRNGVTDRSAHLAEGMRMTLANIAAAAAPNGSLGEADDTDPA